MDLNSILLGSEDPGRLKDYYAKLFGEPGWGGGGFSGWRIGSGWMAVGPHDQVKGKNPQPGRVIWNIETADVRGDFERSCMQLVGELPLLGIVGAAHELGLLAPRLLLGHLGIALGRLALEVHDQVPDALQLVAEDSSYIGPQPLNTLVRIHLRTLDGSRAEIHANAV